MPIVLFWSHIWFYSWITSGSVLKDHSWRRSWAPGSVQEVLSLSTAKNALLKKNQSFSWEEEQAKFQPTEASAIDPITHNRGHTNGPTSPLISVEVPSQPKFQVYKYLGWYHLDLSEWVQAASPAHPYTLLVLCEALELSPCPKAATMSTTELHSPGTHDHIWSHANPPNFLIQTDQ